MASGVMGEMSLRPGRPGDAAACGRVIAAASLAGTLAERLPHARPLLEDASPLEPDGRQRLIADIEGGTVAGFADYAPEQSHLRYLFVAPEHQGRGIGQALLRSVAETVPPPLRLHCLAINDRALAWYMGQGFAIEGGFLKPFNDVPAVWICMVADGIVNPKA